MDKKPAESAKSFEGVQRKLFQKFPLAGGFKLATFNANSIRARLPIILDWLAAESPDALCVQETKVQDHEFPAAVFEDAGYFSSFHGQKSYNGVAVFTRAKPDEVAPGMNDGAEDPEQARLIRVRVGELSIVNTYVPQGFEPGSDKFHYKLEWLNRLGEYFKKNFKPGDLVVWTGDMNVAPEPIDVHDPVRLKNKCGFHPDEQAALKKVVDWGFEDVFRRHVRDAGQYTFWDYRAPKTFERNLGWRVDHIFATAPLAAKSHKSWIDTAPRAREKPSDHTFLAAVFNL